MRATSPGRRHDGRKEHARGEAQRLESAAAGVERGGEARKARENCRLLLGDGRQREGRDEGRNERGRLCERSGGHVDRRRVGQELPRAGGARRLGGVRVGKGARVAAARLAVEDAGGGVARLLLLEVRSLVLEVRGRVRERLAAEAARQPARAPVRRVCRVQRARDRRLAG